MTLLVGLIALGVAKATWGHGGWAGGWAGAYGVGAPWAAGHWGGAPAPVHDTPEVAAAKAAHLAAHAAVRSGAWAGGAGAWHGGAGGWAGGDDGQWHDDTHQYDTYGNWGGNDDGQWHGDHSGHWNGDNGQWHGDDGQWHGDNGQWHGDHSGQWNPATDGSWAGNYNAWAANGGVWAGHAGNAWGYGGGWGAHGAHGVPHDTPEVAAAKAAHLAAHAAAAHRWRRSVYGLGLAAPVVAAHGVLGVVNPNALPVPLDDVHTAAAKNAQLVQQAVEGTRNVLGGGVPLVLPADTHEVAVGKVAHAVATETQKALVGAHHHGVFGHGLVGAHLW